MTTKNLSVCIRVHPRPNRFLLIALLAATAAFAADTPRLVFTKSFPGSNPAYFSVTVDRSGKVAYTESPTDEPDTFQMEPDAVRIMFDLADKLDHFKVHLESGLKVANMGAKTLRWENGAETSEAKYNYSLDENARGLQVWFESISDSQRIYLELARAIRHDKLGVHQALLRVQALWDQKHLVGTEQFLPILDKVAKDDTFIHMAQERAAQLGEAIRARAKAKAE